MTKNHNLDNSTEIIDKLKQRVAKAQKNADNMIAAMDAMTRLDKGETREYITDKLKLTDADWNLIDTLRCSIYPRHEMIWVKNSRFMFYLN